MPDTRIASLHWQLFQVEEALIHLLRGTLHERQISDDLARIHKGKRVSRGGDYWQGFGDLWNACCRRFIMAICAQHLVRPRLRQALEAGVVVRNLVPPSSRGWLVQRGIEAALA